MAQFSQRMVTEVVQRFWAAMARGEFITDAAAEAGTYRMQGTRWLRAEGGVRPRRGRGLKGRCLTFSEREEIAVARAGGESMRSIARRLERHPSTISRELTAMSGIRVGIARRRRTRWRMSARADPSRPSLSPTSSCAARWRKISVGATRPSRSSAGCAPIP
jgi:Helix-turn-helix domain